MWNEAVAKVKKDDQKLAEIVDELAFTDGEDAETLMTANDLTSFISRLEQEMTHVGINGKISDIFQKAVPIVDKFVVVGDVAVGCNPTPATLPWAAVRFILLVR